MPSYQPRLNDRQASGRMRNLHSKLQLCRGFRKQQGVYCGSRTELAKPHREYPARELLGWGNGVEGMNDQSRAKVNLLPSDTDRSLFALF